MDSSDPKFISLKNCMTRNFVPFTHVAMIANTLKISFQRKDVIYKNKQFTAMMDCLNKLKQQKEDRNNKIIF